MAIINLPDIEGVEGAVYDSEKPYWEQDIKAVNWALEVMKLPREETECLSESLNGRIRWPKQVWNYEGFKLTQFRTYINGIDKNAWNEHRRIFELEFAN